MPTTKIVLDILSEMLDIPEPGRWLVEETNELERIKSMKELIEDIHMRLTVRDEPDEDLIIDAGRPSF